MSGFLDQQIQISTYTIEQSDAGIDYRELDTETTIWGDIQPDSSGEAEDLRIRSGVITGKMYVDINQTTNSELMTVTDSNGLMWELQGPAVQVNTADVKWVTIRRQSQ